MRRVLLIALAALLLTLPATLALAQPPPPEPTPDPATLSAQDAAARAERAAQEARDAAEESARYAGEASNFLGIFESVGTAIGVLTGVVVPLIAGVAAFAGLRGLSDARNELSEASENVQKELKEARERFESDMATRQAELNRLRQDLEQSAANLREELQGNVQLQRESSARATLALALLPLGERQYRAQDYKGALDTYQRALDLDSDNPVTHYRMGYVYTQSGQLEEAVQHLTRALEIAPDFAPALAALGYVYRRIGEKMAKGIDRDEMLNKAEQKLLQALKLSPKLIDDDGESWWGSLGGLYRRRGQLEEAINAYNNAAEVTPHSSYPFSNLALLYVQKNDRESMLRTYKRVERLAAGEVQAEVDNYWAYADLIVARLALGRSVDDILDTAIGTAPMDSPYTLDSLIDTLGRLSAVLTAEEQAPVKRVITHIREVAAERRLQTEAQAAAN
ncbi:MAG: tetratricopeptide repeat protein [Chloroflexi bacterium]|nr:tetratricopeptide repeat protein [Chloroflexota bacterium]